jgi:hypothetical protein
MHVSVAMIEHSINGKDVLYAVRAEIKQDERLHFLTAPSAVSVTTAPLSLSLSLSVLV